MSEQDIILGHIMKVFFIACVLFGLSCIGVAYTIHDKWKIRKKRILEEKMREEWMEENEAKFSNSWKCEDVDGFLPF